MQKFFITTVVCFLLVPATSCSRRAGLAETNLNSNTFPATIEFTDPGLALAEGNRSLDTGETDKAIDALSQAVKLDPDLAEGWFKLGVAYALAEKRDQTLETIENEESPSDKKRTKANSVKAFEKAVVAYKKIITANPDDHAAYFNLGRAYNKLNDDEDAAKALKQAVKLQPDDTEYQTELGAILIKLAQYHEAIAPLKKALEIDPENIRAQELLEDAEAGRSRVSYSSTPREDKKKQGDNTNAISNTTPSVGNVKLPPPTPDHERERPRPSPSRPAKP